MVQMDGITLLRSIGKERFRTMKYTENVWASVTIEEDGKYYSYIKPISAADNALSKLTIKGIVSASIYRTKKQAAEVVTCWNECYKKNGTYLFDSPKF